MVEHACIPAIGKLRQEIQEFQTRKPRVYEILYLKRVIPNQKQQEGGNTELDSHLGKEVAIPALRRQRGDDGVSR